MKEIVLAVLKNNRGSYVSGEELSKELQVSRTTIWKQIKVLREEGYEIASSPKRGYRLTDVSDLLTPMEIRDGLKTNVMGKTIYHYPQVDSTNSIARELAAQGADEGTLVIADSQMLGRGRMGRVWSSPVGGIWLSLIVRPQIPSFQVALITLLTAVVAAETTQNVCNLVSAIKWPNDLLVNNKKLAGILTEVSAEIDCVRHLVIGVGMNANIPVALLPPDVQLTATSILAETGSQVDRAVWVRRFLELFEQNYNDVRVNGFANVLAHWRTYSCTLGQVVTVHLAGKCVTGYAVDIDEQGALILETQDGIEKFWAGEVSLKKTIDSRGE